MNKAELIEDVALRLDTSKAAAGRAVEAVLEAVADHLADGGTYVRLSGFGTFSVKERAARVGRNLQTGAKMDIAASRKVGFKAWSTLNDRV